MIRRGEIPAMRKPPPEERLSRWFSQWRRPLQRWLGSHRRIPEADLDDVAQDVFLRLLHYDRAEVIDAPQAYLFRVAANVANEWALRARNQRPHDAKWLAGLTFEDQPTLETAREQSLAQVARAILGLPPRTREVLRLKFNEGLTNAEIAARLGLHPVTIKRDLLHSYSRLRLELSPELLPALEDHRELR
jgi:RNA polymerase sigma factor (sigma-70 family)